MSNDFSQQILRALLSNECAAPIEIIETNLPLIEQKKYLKKNVDLLSPDNKLALGKILVDNHQRKLIKECSEGTIINMDILPEKVITAMYCFVKYILDEK